MLFAVPAASLLLLIAAIHVYWGAGGTWPVSDEPALVGLVIGKTPSGRMPPLSACIGISLLLVAAAVLVLAAAGAFGAGVASTLLVRVGIIGVVGVLGLRGVGGLLMPLIPAGRTGEAFDVWNVRLYSPLCVAIAALVAVAAWG